MTPGELVECSVKALGQLIASRQVSPVEVINAFVERADRFEAAIGSFITRTAEQALQEARQAEQEITLGRYRGPLHGITGANVPARRSGPHLVFRLLIPAPSAHGRGRRRLCGAGAGLAEEVQGRRDSAGLVLRE